jgi:3-oxoacyl-[acyl-carrier protein] reductase
VSDTESAKVALVTGASRGIGRAIALRLAQNGVHVAVHYNSNRDKANEVVMQIEQGGGKGFAVGGSLEDVQTPVRLVSQTLAHFGRLDILVNNAGIYEAKPLADITPEHFTRLLHTNTQAPLLLIREAAPHLPSGGRIVNVSSYMTQLNQPEHAVYAASKAALDSITRVLSAELGPRNITVNGVAPGTTATEVMQDVLSEDAKAGIASQTHLRRMGTPEDVADVVAFLASENARWITGQIIAATGGL